MRFGIAILSALAMTACNTGAPDINQVQVNLVDKQIFEGEWWALQTAVDVDGDTTAFGSAASLYMYSGGSSFADLGVDRGGSATIARIRWVIDQDFLYAYRAYELIDGGNDDGRDDDFRGQPIGAFMIEDHIDIRRNYNAVTGETTNVVVEDTADRRWFERDYMRIDWTMNHANSFSWFNDYINVSGLVGRGWRHEPVPFQIDERGSHDEIPPELAPQFVRVGDDPDYRFAGEWPEEMADTIHYMSFVSMMAFSPGGNCLLIGGGNFCSTITVPVRTAFLRVPPNHDYAVGVQPHQDFDRFGLFRTEQRTYIRGGRGVEVQAIHCTSDAECNGHACDLEQNICVGGLTADRGETDFLTFYKPRHNLFAQSLTDQECRSDWQCDGRFADTPGTAGSTCDRSARRCTIPMRDRELRPVTYHLNDGYPAFLVAPAYEVMANWNEVFVRGWRGVQGEALPNYAAINVSCQSDDPTRHCFCGSADDLGDGTCVGEYDPFVTPDEWRGLGVEAPVDCYVANADGFSEPTRPDSYDDYTIPAAYRYEMVGSECMFTLKTNNCDWWRTEAGMACSDVVDGEGNGIRYEQQGDIRYQFFNYIDQIGTAFGGVSELLADPTTGELITADANYASAITQNLSMVANEWFPVMRCVNDGGCAPGEEGAADRWLVGDNLRDYFADAGRIDLPIAVAASGADGTGTGGGGRPELPAGLGLRDAFLETIVREMPKLETLHGEGARANIFSDRMRNLAGTPIESDLMDALGPQILQAHLGQLGGNHLDGEQLSAFRGVDVQATTRDQATLDQISPFRNNNFVRNIDQHNQLAWHAAKLNFDFAQLTDPRDFLRNRVWEYYAEAFRGRPNSEAAIRIQQMYLRNVQYHEIGHSVGLRHNFAGSYDRNNYADGYFNLVLNEGLALPRLEDFDLPENGGNSDGFVGTTEVNSYREELRRVRNERLRRGSGNYMTGSIMDYNGDLSDSAGLGRYEKAATYWSYFDLVEMYEGDPRISSSDSTDGLHRSSETVRNLWATYAGGESCNVDNDCGFAAGSPSLVPGQDVTQRCVAHPRYTRLPEPCDGRAECVCSRFDEDVRDAVDGVEYNIDGDGDRIFDYFPVRYLFCSDERAIDISWCTRQDAGESFQETIDFYRQNWYQGYANNYNRRFYRGVRTGASFPMILESAKVFQHLFFRLFFEPGFTANEGPIGFSDQFQASIDSMNWFMELVNLPDEGSYQMNADRNVYEFMGEEMDMAGADFSLGSGSGFGMWTKFQDGQRGFFKAERGGVFWDKFYALFALAIRDWNLSFTVDERFFINYYDLFAIPITEFFGGVIMDNPRAFAPRVDMSSGSPEIEHMSWYRGLALGECVVAGAAQPCVDSNEVEYPGPAIDGTSNIVLRSWATILALAQFAVFYDSSFEQRLIIFRLGDGSGHDIPDFQPDGSPACAYGERLDPAHNLVNPAVPNGCDTFEDATYVVYNSERLHTPYVAVTVEPRLTYNLQEEQLGFEYLRRLVDMQNDPTVATERLQEQESFLEYLIQLQAEYGISNYFGI
ncbi:MAG: zinc-dependent metalloprotease [Myxococcota bacterium]